jgi:hypothetical protein
MSDREIENAVKSDPDAVPILDKEWFPEGQTGPAGTQGADLATNAIERWWNRSSPVKL